MRKYLLAASAGGSRDAPLRLSPRPRALCRDRRRRDVPATAPTSTSSSTTHADTDLRQRLMTSSTRPDTTSTRSLGYKFGLFRLEGEAGYKRANIKSLGVSTPLITDVGTAAGDDCHCRRLQRRQPHRHQVADGQRACSTAISAAASAAMPAAAPAGPGRQLPGTATMPGRSRASPALRYALSPERRCRV